MPSVRLTPAPTVPLPGGGLSTRLPRAHDRRPL
jgi:hypothetical protein